MDTTTLDFDKGDGLIPAVVQDAHTYRVLMLGYMNREALEKTLKENKVTFYSRSRERLWTKGETSGNTLELVDIQADCDNDTLLVLADPAGPTCHTGAESCFHEKEFKPQGGSLHFLEELEELIRDRKEKMPEGSYTTYLFESGTGKIAQKVGEESVEAIIEALNSNNEQLTDEVSDLIYHLLVLLADRGLSLETIANRLAERHGQNQAGG